jgi:phage tail tape-measure protein
MGYFDDETVGSTATGALSGAGTGAVIGSVIPGIGTGIGAGVGALAGGLGGLFSGKANKKKKQGLANARKQMQELARQQYAQRMADLETAMGYFKPVDSKLRDLYGDGAATDFTPPKRMY